MNGNNTYDAVVVGAGPNGLTAAVILARAGLRVHVVEAAAVAGGGTRTEELTLPGFRNDVCSAVHPLGAGSPALRALPLQEHGLRWVQPPLPMAHPLDGTSAVTLSRSLEETADSLGLDARAYRRLVAPLIGHWDELSADALRPIASTLPRHPLLLARFGMRGVLPVAALAALMPGKRGRALLGGLAAHAIARPITPSTGGVAVLFALAAHDVGWPFPAGGSQAIADSLVSLLRSCGGTVETAHRVASLRELPQARAYVLDLAPWNVGAITGDALPQRYLRRLQRWPHGPAVFKLDYALSQPVPWRDQRCASAGTVHLGGTFPEIAAALRDVAKGRAPEHPFLIVAQPSLFDPLRAPDGMHTLWVYGHVPAGWQGDLTGAIERQIERFAPGFRDTVLARTAAGPAELERRNPNLVDGDIGGGAFGGHRAFFRPLLKPVPYATPNESIFLCSSSTPPGPGAHGMCGYHAARVVMRRVFHTA